MVYGNNINGVFFFLAFSHLIIRIDHLSCTICIANPVGIMTSTTCEVVNTRNRNISSFPYSISCDRTTYLISPSFYKSVLHGLVHHNRRVHPCTLRRTHARDLWGTVVYQANGEYGNREQLEDVQIRACT